ncbi:alpha/beta hydrolase [Novosphingobium mathurense]|uniref:AB hydrolase-1 domain-containing protein n=1 Tax=Novosphingobium mathurense TaxID=428990 RepID=A0A1U6ILY4_9SPHN|nr:alpha/beta fold hydrolase [Novosphingobium mathurense]SLK08994.1 hypothetical protein SAMN06295987_10960 [Novosphingobium mathurense]
MSGSYDSLSGKSDGQTLHADHASVFYQLPVLPRRLPIVFWHGNWQSSRCWQSTPDGREGFQSLFLRRGYGVYLLDQPRRGHAGRTSIGTVIEVLHDEQRWFETFRLGHWPGFFDNVQFSKNPEALEQFFRLMLPNTGPFDLDLAVGATSALFDRLEAGILMTHSHSGGLGWLTAMKNPGVRGIIAIEPALNFVFPVGDAPEPITVGNARFESTAVTPEEFRALTRIPILVIYGDNIPDERADNPYQDRWRIWLQLAKKWRDVVNRAGGHVTLVHLPKHGITGNTHFPFSDINNAEVASLIATFLETNGLSGRDS